MSIKGKAFKLNKKTLLTVGIIFFVISSLAMLIVGTLTSKQAKSPLMPKISFVGEYKIGEGDWRRISEGEFIPANRGKVTLKGYFSMDILAGDDPEMRVPEGTSISFYLNHISACVYEEGSEERWVMDAENEYLEEDACGQIWIAYIPIDNVNKLTYIEITNPHKYGNASAVNDLLDSMYVYATPYFENMALGFGEVDRAIGLVAIIIAFIVLGIALFSALLHTKFVNELAIIGLMILFGGIYFLFGSDAVAFWNESVIFNTMVKGLSSMFYIIAVFATAARVLSGYAKRIAFVSACFTGAVGTICVLSAIIFPVYFYDTIPYFVAAAVISGIALLVGLVLELHKKTVIERVIRLLASLIILSYVIDATVTAIGWWQGGEISRNAFIITLVTQMVVVLQIIPKNISAAVKARELEAEKIALDAELAQSRISTMMSQIRPHFIYNTLGSIEQLCELDPAKAGELVHNFAKYLRGNFGELDNPKPIRMSQEMEHVRHYISIENVRFPDMTFTFEMNSGDFKLPALTIQPIVENAIKHGLMKLSKGGEIKVTSFENETEYLVSVEDNGVGFDTEILIDDRKHLGLRNIRERLKAMVNGRMEIQSQIGEGTKVLIIIPKEAN